MNRFDAVLDAVMYRGRAFSIRRAWLMARAGYLYTRGFPDPDGKRPPIIDCLRHAWWLFRKELWRPQ